MAIDFAFVWAMLIAVAVLAYVLLDGFDLGIGVLFPLLGTHEDRGLAMNSVAPVWDGNETWLILGGGGLLAVFPLAYAILLPALYAPIIAMLLGLVLRGVAFEFRWRTQRWRPLWDWAFTGGSIVAALSQGIMLGAIVQGIKVVDRAYAGGWYDWLSPFSIFTGLSLLVGYALLGTTWLVLKTEGELQERAYGFARPLMFALLGAIAIVSIWMMFLDPRFADRWLSMPTMLYVAPVPLLTLWNAWRLMRAVRQRRQLEPFLATIALFLLCYLGLGINLYPHIVPPSVTFWQAAAPDKSLRFLLVGALILIPLILAYTAYSYWVFRGKVRPGDAYH